MVGCYICDKKAGMRLNREIEDEKERYATGLNPSRWRKCAESIFIKEADRCIAAYWPVSSPS